MTETLISSTEFSDEEIRILDVELKIGILGTVTDTGLPHLTMISTLRPYAPRGLVWGQFTEGLSKSYIQVNPKTGFAIMSLDKYVVQGKAKFSHTAQQGSEYENYNNLPMFRYNAYFGVHTVYYLDLVAGSGFNPLPMSKVITSAVLTILARSLARKKERREVLNPWVRSLFNKVDNLKFLGYIGGDGYPVVRPVIQAQAWDSQRVIFSTAGYGDQFMDIPVDIPMAVFGMTFDMEDVLLRGRYSGIQRIAGIPCGVVEIDWVYNTMPPTPKQIYPPLVLKPIKEF